MIKPVNITPLNTSTRLEYECEHCLNIGAINLTNSIVNVDYDGAPLEELDYDCPKCERKL
ncbi:MAG: hypothetical protein WDZ88_01735 [Candidatus Paceibacterota bacterium]